MINRFPFFWLLLYLVIYSMAWHFSLLGFSPFPFLENRQSVSRLLLLYPTLIFVLSLPFLALFLKYPKSLALKTCAILFFTLSLLIRAVDWNIIYYYGGHIDALFWENAFYADGVGMLFTRVTASLALASIILLALFIFLLRTVIDHYIKCLNKGIGISEYVVKQYILPYILIFSLLLLITGLIVQPFFSSHVSSTVYTRSLPEKRFLSSITDYLKEDNFEIIVLDEEEKDRLRLMGLEIESVSKDYPLMKNSIYIDGIRQARQLTQQPNIIIIFIESLSSYFIEDPEIRKYHLTANIDDFIQQSLYFDRILNAITPTLQGQIAVLASSLHLYRSTMAENKWSKFDDVKDQFSDIKAATLTEYPMVSKLLKSKSYISTHIQAGPGSFGDTENFFRLRGGFDQFYSASSEEALPNRSLPLGIWGASDIDTFRLATQWLNNNHHNPFLLTISSIDIHHPYHTETRKDGIENSLLNCVYSSDVAFGIFWDYFKQSHYKDNTIVVLTADHPIFPTADYLQLRKQPPTYYDYIPVAIYSPFHTKFMGTRDHTIGTNLDIAPTLFEIIGHDSKNAFLGLSLLSERKKYPHFMGRINLEEKFNDNATDWNDTDQSRLIKYLKSLSMHNLLYKEQ